MRPAYYKPEKPVNTMEGNSNSTEEENPFGLPKPKPKSPSDMKKESKTSEVSKDEKKLGSRGRIMNKLKRKNG